MLVDDSDTQRRLQKNILKKHGLEDFVEAANGQEAIEKATSQKPDIILLDWNMPVMDGYTMATKLRENQELKKYSHHHGYL